MSVKITDKTEDCQRRTAIKQVTTPKRSSPTCSISYHSNFLTEDRNPMSKGHKIKVIPGGNSAVMITEVVPLAPAAKAPPVPSTNP